MGKTFLGVGLAAVVLWVWGFLFWGVNPLPYAAAKVAANPAAAEAALRQQFPGDGVYFLPTRPAQPGAGAGTGLQATVTVRDGVGSGLDVGTLVQGLVLNLVFCGLLALLMHRVRGTARTYSGRLGVPFWAGVAAVVLIDGGDLVWWGAAASWKAWQAAYDFSAFLVAGAVLAAFVKGQVRERLV